MSTVTSGTSNATNSAGSALYVAQDGNDSWSGRLAKPNASGTDGPLATLGAAQAKMESSSIKATYVETGTYNLNSTLDLASSDSGETWATYKGESVTLNGGTLHRAIYVNASNVTLSGFTLVGGSSSGSYAVQLSNSSNFTLKGLTISEGAGGILVDGGSQNSHISGNSISNQTEYGVSVIDGSNHITVDRNTIYNIGVADQGIGIWFEDGSDNVFTNNNISYTGKFGIGGGTVNTSDGPTDDNRISHNTIDHAVLSYQDAGAINLFDDEQNSTGDSITSNTVTNTGAGNPGAWINPGVYLDNFASGVTVYGNLMENNVDGVWVHLGHNNTINHNVIIGSQIGLTMDGTLNNGLSELQPPTGNVFENDTVYIDTAGASLARLSDDPDLYAVKGTKWLHNTYGGPDLSSTPFIYDVNHISSSYTFAQWTALGADTTSAAPSTQLTLAQALANLPK